MTTYVHVTVTTYVLVILPWQHMYAQYCIMSMILHMYMNDVTMATYVHE